ncbi:MULTISPECIES: S9 family peptidase [Acidobacteriaceae]|uniref:S9 family peptidase n=1 Tax=Acidobacteriaceae TaxID=204434 RepID=UPI00131B2B27|nr:MULTISPECIES: S9 family peptidase [Acidobacteriaceae]MDW5266582.1 S9 family peptidase [Edaphobacter sp.]
MTESIITPPTARQEPTPTTLHGHTLEDNYRWMRDKDSPEVITHLQAENQYTLSVMAPTTELQTRLYAEMLSHIKETDESVPYRHRGWFYYTRTVEGSQYPIHCRKLATSPTFDPTQPEEILLDVNQLAEGQPFMSLGGMSVSPDGTKLAYSTDNTGFRQYTLHIRDLKIGNDLSDTAERVGSLVWAADSHTLFYTTEDEVTKRQDKLYRHRLGDVTEDDALVYEEKDERFNLGVGKTRDGKYLLMESGSHTTNECSYLPADTPGGVFLVIAPRVDEQEYYVDHRNGLFYIRTNDTGKNFRVVTIPVDGGGRESWAELIPEDKNAPLEDFDVFDSFCVSSSRELGLTTIEVIRFTPDNKLGTAEKISFPEPAYTAQSHINREFVTNAFRYSYQSLVSPASVYDYDLASGTSTLLKQQEVPGGFDSTRYASERVWITAEDGVKVPISLVYRRDAFQRDGTSPLYIYGYGSYGYPLPIGFSPSRLSLLDRGVVMAYAHIRGGGEMGDQWHDAGKMMAKRNTFTDFIAVTEQLVAQGYGAKDRVAIEGGSAGGLLMGAVVNQRPDLFHVVLSHVPFVDVMNTMLDASLPLTVAEYEEWGNPNESEAFAYMSSYSPYDNLKAADYPAMLVKTSLNDSQVMYWEPAKYVAKLRTLKTNDAPLLLHINMDAGHGGASGRYDYLKEIAFDYAFLLTQLGVEK